MAAMANMMYTSDSSESDGYPSDVDSSSSLSTHSNVPSLLSELSDTSDDDMLAYATSTSSDSGSDEEFYELVDMHRLRKKLASKEYLSPDDPETDTQLSTLRAL